MSARALLEHGLSHLAIFDVDEQQGTAAVKHYYSISQELKPQILFKKVDISEETQLNKAVEDVAKQFGGIDILVSFAGITGSKLAVEYPIEEWRRIFEVNVHGTFLTARAVAKFVLLTFRICQAIDCSIKRNNSS